MTIWMMTKEGKQPVRGTVVGPLFVHKSLLRNTASTYYSISNSTTGRYVVSWISGKEKALKIAKALAELKGWGQGLRLLTRDSALQREVVAVLKQFGIRKLIGSY